MTVLTRWDPFREFSTLQDRMNRLFQQSYGDREEALTTSTFAPAVDVYEDEHNVTLKIEVPGIDEKDIDVRIENNTLTVHGERNFEEELSYGSSYPLGPLPRVFHAAGSHESPVPAVVWGPRRSFDHQHVRPGSGYLRGRAQRNSKDRS